MNDILYLIFGSIILLATIYDFFFTTLSGSGEGFITHFVSQVSHTLIQLGVKIFGRKVYSISGMFVNLVVLGIWIVLVWTGLFLVFSSNPDAIVNSNNRVATSIERLYYTGYILSTLGIGNFKPLTPFFELLTSIFSFFGFVFFTTSMTYLISLSSGVIFKRTIALSINNLGETPDELAKSLMEKDSSYRYQKFSSLQEMIDRHYVNHQAYPILHYYGNTDIPSSFSLHLAILDEAINILLFKTLEKQDHKELLPLRSSITHFLKKMHQKASRYSIIEIDSYDNLPAYDQKEGEYQEGITIEDRRKVLSNMLKNEGFGWNDVYSSKKGTITYRYKNNKGRL
jgi:ABC-type multidrug transport system fused ATPase/permease subunit